MLLNFSLDSETVFGHQALNNLWFRPCWINLRKKQASGAACSSSQRELKATVLCSTTFDCASVITHQETTRRKYR